jgi:structural maintenance of chromosome 2
MPQKLQSAKHLAPGKVRPALSLVGYPDEVAEAIAFVFSDTMICDDAASAQAITFSREVGVRSVTLEGDVYEPSGTMSGGAAPSGSGILARAQELRVAEERVAAARKTFAALEREEVARRAARDKWRERTREIEIKEHELRLLEEQVGSSNAARVRYVFPQLSCTKAFPFPTALDWCASRRAQALYCGDGGCLEGRAGETGDGQGGDQEARKGHG